MKGQPQSNLDSVTHLLSSTMQSQPRGSKVSVPRKDQGGRGREDMDIRTKLTLQHGAANGQQTWAGTHLLPYHVILVYTLRP